MTIKIKKTAATEWAGNGFGTNAARWVVAGSEHISIIQFGGGWSAIDSRADRRIVNGAATRADCLEILEVKLAAQAA